VAHDLATRNDGVPLGAPLVLKPEEAIEAGSGEHRGGEERPLALAEDRDGPVARDQALAPPENRPAGGREDRDSFLNGVPFPMYFFLATVWIVAALGDLRILRFGAPRGGPRLARHLWRMCFALFIAAGSFFSIRARVAKILPKPFTTGPMRALPILLLFGAMFYWLWRVRARRSLPTQVPGD